MVTQCDPQEVTVELARCFFAAHPSLGEVLEVSRAHSGGMHQTGHGAGVIQPVMNGPGLSAAAPCAGDQQRPCQPFHPSRCPAPALNRLRPAAAAAVAAAAPATPPEAARPGPGCRVALRSSTQAWSAGSVSA